MTTPIQDASPAQRQMRARPGGRARRCALAAVLVLVLLIVGFVVATWRATADWDRVDIAVTNTSSKVAVAGLFIYGNFVQPELAVRPVKPGGTGRASYHTRETVGGVTLRVQVGPDTIYEGDGGVLVDDDGPHRFTVTVRDDGVTVRVDQEDKAPWEMEMTRVQLGQRPGTE